MLSLNLSSRRAVPKKMNMYGGIREESKGCYLVAVLDGQGGEEAAALARLPADLPHGLHPGGGGSRGAGHGACCPCNVHGSNPEGDILALMPDVVSPHPNPESPRLSVRGYRHGVTKPPLISSRKILT